LISVIGLWADVGLTDDYYKKYNFGDDFVYDAGLSLNLLKGAAKIYFPIVASPSFQTYENRIKFTLNLPNPFEKARNFSL
jgi:hypothetical protein